jgi:hypothetical protein
MEYLEEKFKDFPEVQFLGCHSGKFDNEKDHGMLRQAVIRYDIKHPVLSDSDFKFWNTCNTNCWPTVVIAGPDGREVLNITGEGNQKILECMAIAALSKFDGELSSNVVPYHLEKDKLAEELKKNGESSIKPEMIIAQKQNLNNPGKVIIVPDINGKDLGYDESVKNLLIVADSSNNRVIILDQATHKCIDVIGNGNPSFKDGSYKDCEFNHT